MDAEFWVALAFVAFVALIARKAYALITAKLDLRAEAIRKELDEAMRLREEAQGLLAGYQRKQRQAADEAEAIIAQANAEALRLREEAERELALSLERRAALAEAKIAQAEAQAVAEVRGLAVDLALSATRKLIADNLDEGRAARLVDDAISEVEGKLRH